MSKRRIQRCCGGARMDCAERWRRPSEESGDTTPDAGVILDARKTDPASSSISPSLVSGSTAAGASSPHAQVASVLSAAGTSPAPAGDVESMAPKTRKARQAVTKRRIDKRINRREDKIGYIPIHSQVTAMTAVAQECFIAAIRRWLTIKPHSHPDQETQPSPSRP